ncbi:MAG: hypothetical protein J5526_02375 [Bacteroidales bacterium]|nr:hypothetical protein [Bacteroidales bacterium]
MKNKGKRALENLAFYSYSNRLEMKKGLDRTFLHYGIRQEDMDIIEDAARGADIDPDWMKEFILKPYNEARNEEAVDEKKLRKILNKALKEVQA